MRSHGKNTDSKLASSAEQAIKQLEQQLLQMSAQFRVAGKYLIDHPYDIAVASMRAIAANAGVKPATLTRLVRYLGHAGWPEFRELFVAPLRSEPAAYAQRAKSIVGVESSDELISDVFKAQERNLQLAETYNHSALKEASTIVEKATHVHVAGFRASYPTAFLFQYLYRFFRNTVSLLSSPGATTEMLLRAVERDDAVIVISFFPYSREAQIVANYAKSKGARLIAITDSPKASIARHADQILVAPIETPSFFPSMVAGIGMIESLIELLLSRAGKDAIQRVEAAEHELMDLAAYERTAKLRTSPRKPRQK